MEPGRSPREDAEAERRLTDRVIRLGFLGLFAYWTMTLVLPLLGIAIWAVVLAVALYPLYDRLCALLGGRRRLAAFLLTVAMFLVVSGPIGLLAANLVETLTGLARALEAGTLTLPQPPARLDQWPVFGEPASRAWTLAATNLEAALIKYGQHLLPAGVTVLRRAALLGGELVLFLVAMVVSGFLLSPGPKLVSGVGRLATRLLAPRGAHFVELAGATIRHISQGVIGVAFLQALLTGILLLVAGVPLAGLAAFAVLLLCIVQIGPMIVLVPVAVWVWFSMSFWPALVFTLLLVPILLFDNLLKPVLLSRGLTTPMPVILAGMFGGTISYGLAGLFLGPVVLAVFYELLLAWAKLDEAAGPIESDGTSPPPAVR